MMKKDVLKKCILIFVAVVIVIAICFLVANRLRNNDQTHSGGNEQEEWLATVNGNIELSEKETLGESITVTVSLDTDENIDSVALYALQGGISEIEATKIDDGVYEAEINFEELNAEDGYYQFEAVIRDNNGNEKEIISEDTVNYFKTGVSYAHAYKKEDGRTAVQITALDKGEVLVSTTNEAPTADDTRWTKYETGEEYIIATPEENVENVYVWYKNGENIINAADSGISVMSFADGQTVTIQEAPKPPFVMEWTIPAGADGTDENGKLQTIIKLPTYTNNGFSNYTVDWGDGKTNTYTREELPEHIYNNTSEEVYEIKITGKLYGFGYVSGKMGNSDRYRPTKTNEYSDYYTFTQYLTSIKSWGELEIVKYRFAFCKNLETIASPEEETFKNVTDFSFCFSYCTKLKSIPADLFDSAVSATNFSYAFYSSGLSGPIPANLFASNTSARDFSNIFRDCSDLSGEIPAELFAKNTSATTFASTFSGCSGLTGAIPAELFANNADATTFQQTFANCSGLSGAIPTNLFANNTIASNFSRTFYNCSGLTSSFININTETVTSNYGMFAGCTNIKYLLLGNNFGKIQSTKSNSSYVFAEAGTYIITLREEPIEFLKYSSYDQYCPATLYVKNSTSNLTIKQKFEQADTEGMFGAERIKEVIELIGDSTITISTKEGYTELGANVAGHSPEDLKDCPQLGLTFEIDTTAVDNALANKTPGEFNVTYTLKLNNEVFATKTRKVTVTAPTYYKNDSDVYFATLADAFTNTATGGTITVLEDVTDASDVALVAGKMITLNTDGKTITKTEYSIKNYGTLTIEGNGTIQTPESTNNSIVKLIQNWGILNLNNVTTIHKGSNLGTCWWYTILSWNGEVNINNSTIEATYDKNIAKPTSGGGRTIGILNNSVLNMNSGRIIESTGMSSAIAIESYTIDSNNGKININSGTIESDCGYAIYNYDYWDGVTQPVINNFVINILGGTITSNTTSAIINGGAYSTITIGTLDGGVNTISPSIQGETYGIESTNGFKFYDGILKGKAGAFTGDVTEVEPYYEVVYGTEESYKTATLSKRNAPPEVAIDINGKELVADPTFANGYVERSYGETTLSRKIDFTAPNDSGYILHIDRTVSAYPGFGGYCYGTQTSANETYITKIIAKIPKGYYINFGSNDIGDDGIKLWLTSQAGTGEWETYIHYARTGSTGTFGTTNYYFINNQIGADTATGGVPWDVAYSQVYKGNAMDWTNQDVSIIGNAIDDAPGVVAYAFTTTDEEPKNWTTVQQATSVSRSYNVTANGIVFFWAKDATDKISKIATYIERIANYQDSAGNFYLTLADAFAGAPDGSTITVLRNVIENTRAIANKTLTLDLNSKTIDASGLTGDWTTGREFIQNQGTLTIIDTDGNGSITRNNVTSHVCVISTTGTLNLNGGTFSLSVESAVCDPSTIAVDSGTTNIYDGANIIATRTVIDRWIVGVYAPNGIVNMFGGHVEAIGIDNSSTAYGIITPAGGSTILNISGGTVRSTGKGITLEDYGGNIVNSQLSVSGNANINGNIYGIFNSAATNGITIDGGTIEGSVGIYQTVPNTIVINDGTITGSYAGVQIFDGTFDMKSGKVTSLINAVENHGIGKIIVEGGEVAAGSTATGLVDWGNGYIEVIGGTVSGGYAGIYSSANSAGEVRIKGGNIIGSSYVVNDPVSGSGICNLGSANVYVENGNISAALKGIYNVGSGTVTIGTLDGGVNAISPSIQGGNHAIDSVNGFQFYDGILKGKTGAFTGSVTEVEPGYGVHYDTEGEYQTATLVDANYQDNKGNYYVTLADAFAKAPSGSTITVLRDVTDNSQGILTSGKTLTLELNGKTINAQGSESIINNQGKLTIQDSIGGGNISRNINALSNYMISNSSEMIITGGKFAINKEYVAVCISSSNILKIENAEIETSIINTRNTGENLTAGIVANGETIINNTKITSRAPSSIYTCGGILCNAGAVSTITLNNVNIDSDIRGIILVNHAGTGGKNGSSLTVQGSSSITGKKYGIYNEYAVGGITIDGGTISGGSAGIYQSVNNTITIGTPSGGVSSTIPSIQGDTYGIDSVNGFKFYDGIVKGKTGAFTGNVTEVETGYGVHYDTEGDYKTAYLVAANYKDNASPENTYDTLANAFNKVATGKTITVIGENVQESTRAILTDNKSIILDLNGKTITYTSDFIGVVDATLEVKDSKDDGEINNTTNYFSALYYHSNGNIIISGGTIKGWRGISRQDFGAVGASVTMTGGQINATSICIDVTTEDTVVVTGGKLISSTDIGINYAQDESGRLVGSLTIGTKGGAPNTQTPMLQGETYAINSVSGFEFYDGILKGKEGAFNGTVTEVETGYGVHYDTEGDYKTAYLVVANYEDNASLKNTYDTLADAFAKAPDGSTITTLRDVTDESFAILNPEKTITLNTDRKTITKTISSIQNYGVLTIEGNGTIQTAETSGNSLSKLLENWGKINLNDVTILHKGPNLPYWWYTVLSWNGEVNINNSTIEATYDKNIAKPTSGGGRTIGILNNSVLNMNSGRIIESIGMSNVIAIESYTVDSNNGKININGGTIESDCGHAIYNYDYWDGVTQPVINNFVINILGGTITSNTTSAIINGGAYSTITIGTPGGKVDTQVPMLQGAEYAIDSTSGFKFYDGILKGKTGAFTGNVTEVETGYGVHYDMEGSYHTATLQLITGGVHMNPTIAFTNIDKVVNKQINATIIFKATAPLTEITIQGETIDVSTVKPTVSGIEYVYEMPYTITQNGVYVATCKDATGRVAKKEQAINAFHTLMVEYEITNTSAYSDETRITFTAAYPFRILSTNPESYKDQVKNTSLTGYAMVNTMLITDDALDVTFIFEDEQGNQSNEVHVQIAGVALKFVRAVAPTESHFKAFTTMDVETAYRLAQEMENKIFVVNEKVESYYGVNKHESDLFMSRARDVGAAITLMNANKTSAFDGTIASDQGGNPKAQIDQYGLQNVGSREEYMASYLKDATQNSLTNADAKYKDVVNNLDTLRLYKGFALKTQDSSEGMFFVRTGLTSYALKTNTPFENTTFRITIVNP